jgi:hypothetical protein
VERKETISIYIDFKGHLLWGKKVLSDKGEMESILD